MIVYNLFRRKKTIGHEWTKLKIISAPKAENKKKMAQSVAYREYLVVRLLQCFLKEAQDETRVGITQQAVRKNKIYTIDLYKK